MLVDERRRCRLVPSDQAPSAAMARGCYGLTGDHRQFGVDAADSRLTRCKLSGGSSMRQASCFGSDRYVRAYSLSERSSLSNVRSGRVPARRYVDACRTPASIVINKCRSSLHESWRAGEAPA